MNITTVDWTWTHCIKRRSQLWLWCDCDQKWTCSFFSARLHEVAANHNARIDMGCGVIVYCYFYVFRLTIKGNLLSAVIFLFNYDDFIRHGGTWITYDVDVSKLKYDKIMTSQGDWRVLLQSHRSHNCEQRFNCEAKNATAAAITWSCARIAILLWTLVDCVRENVCNNSKK